MPLPLRDLVELVIEYHRKYRLPVPAPRDVVYKWAYKLGIPRGGDTVIYTGALYQLIPYIRVFVDHLSRLEEVVGVTALLKLVRRLGIEEALTSLVTRVSEEDVRKQYEILEKIALLLRKAGVNYGYLYEDDIYPGTVLYLLGLESELRSYAKEVYERLKFLGVKTLITLDPHTTHLMKYVYREIVDGYDIRVRSYIEVLGERLLSPVRKINVTTTIHDPCYYARYLGLVDEPRKLLEMGGVTIEEASRGKRFTSCCGGPIEFIAPHLAESITRHRLEELEAVSKNIVTLCPICHLRFSMLRSEDTTIVDIVDYLYAIYGD